MNNEFKDVFLLWKCPKLSLNGIIFIIPKQSIKVNMTIFKFERPLFLGINRSKLQWTQYSKWMTSLSYFDKSHTLVVTRCVPIPYLVLTRRGDPVLSIDKKWPRGTSWLDKFLFSTFYFLSVNWRYPSYTGR